MTWPEFKDILVEKCNPVVLRMHDVHQKHRELRQQRGESVNELMDRINALKIQMKNNVCGNYSHSYFSLGARARSRFHSNTTRELELAQRSDRGSDGSHISGNDNNNDKGKENGNSHKRSADGRR